MKILLTGANGQVGWELSRSLLAIGDVVALQRIQCDLAQPHMVAAVVRELRPDVIVNAAAYTAVDGAEDEEALATTVNATSVGVLAEETRRLGALLVHYSTDYVFDGTKTGPYVESDEPCPLGAYGRSKLKGEQAVAAEGGDTLVLRTAWVYAARGRNFLQTVLRLAQGSQPLRVVDDQLGTPNWARTIAETTARIVGQAMMERQAGSFGSGLYHLTAQGAATWFGFARAILAQVATLDPAAPLMAHEVIPIATADYPTAARRPKNSQLDGTLLANRFRVARPHWRADLDSCLKDFTGFGADGRT